MPVNEYKKLNKCNKDKNDMDKNNDQTYISHVLGAAAKFIPGEEVLQYMSAVLKMSSDLSTKREAYKAGYNNAVPDTVYFQSCSVGQLSNPSYISIYNHVVQLSVHPRRRVSMVSVDMLILDRIGYIVVMDGDDNNEDDVYEAEILLLETSNAYGTATKRKSGFDHHKAMFRSLTMLKSFADEYPMASYENLAEVIREIRLWSFYTPSRDVYVMNRDWTNNVSTAFAKRDIELYSFANNFYDLKVNKLAMSLKKMDKMRQEHFHQAREYRFCAFPQVQLPSNIVHPLIENITYGRDANGMHEHLTKSSLAACSNESNPQYLN
ncbi:hypothetical protein BDA99DRAFT_574810 [Phascolomyces articulosus]|uniref:Uncharacterized protein n=1 Tax=Phascolomyces articulosus TaxID=60185 RepID=A0AAD5PC35_9FUNG|nr:hypothetical protein BDA99DRAFT_574810 [Phascolomyces articulosus]